jgi:anti-sigma factor RsiW
MTHLNENVLTAYVAEEISDPDRLAIDLHLSECDDCVKRVRAMISLRESFDEIWTSWNAEEHARIKQQLRLLEGIESTKLPLSRRALSWIAKITDGTNIALKMLSVRAEQIAALAASALPPNFNFEVRAAISGVGSPEQEALLDRKLAEGNSALAANRADQAIKSLREASHMNAMIAQSASSIIYRESKKYAEVTIDARRGSLLVKHWPQGDSKAEFVLLLPADPLQTPAIGAFTDVAGEGYRLATLDDYPDGACDLIIGPSH